MVDARTELYVGGVRLLREHKYQMVQMSLTSYATAYTVPIVTYVTYANN
jgi:hypothetical protein